MGPEGSLVSSLAGEGAVIQGRVEHSVIFYDVTVEAGATVTDSVVMPGTVIEAGATVEHAILGERCRVRAGAVVRGTGCAIKVYGNDAVVLPADAADGAAADKGV